MGGQTPRNLSTTDADMPPLLCGIIAAPRFRLPLEVRSTNGTRCDSPAPRARGPRWLAGRGGALESAGDAHARRVNLQLRPTDRGMASLGRKLGIWVVKRPGQRVTAEVCQGSDAHRTLCGCVSMEHTERGTMAVSGGCRQHDGHRCSRTRCGLPRRRGPGWERSRYSAHPRRPLNSSRWPSAWRPESGAQRCCTGTRGSRCTSPAQPLCHAASRRRAACATAVTPER